MVRAQRGNVERRRCVVFSQPTEKAKAALECCGFVGPVTDYGSQMTDDSLHLTYRILINNTVVKERPSVICSVW